MTRAKSFDISKQDVVRAWKRVKANKGAAGVDEISIADFEIDLKNNLYKIWNRMSSGSYFPPPVRRVEIPKGDGKTRPLGIPTVGDRIAQMVVVQILQPLLEPKFHGNSYGYRPGKSAHDALEMARLRTWHHPWVLDLDIKGFFGAINHKFMMAAVRRHTTCTWVLLYIKRWLEAPVQMPDGTIVERTQGTPEGGCVSPILANLYLHYAFDMWMLREYSSIAFERYADDIICHCRSEEQALHLKDEITRRFARWHLELHPQKTKIVYCKDIFRKERHPNVQFDFLGYTFQPRVTKGKKGQTFIGFDPAISRKAATEIRQEIRRMRLHLRTHSTLSDIAEFINPKLRGWINYYGAIRRSEVLYVLEHHLDKYLAWWATRKYRTLNKRRRRARDWVKAIKARQPTLFAHWALLPRTT